MREGSERKKKVKYLNTKLAVIGGFGGWLGRMWDFSYLYRPMQIL